VVTRDPHKPVWIDLERLLSPTVDHVDPISKFGTNDLANLEVLCHFCNQGKADGSPILLKHEYQYGALLPLSALEWESESRDPGVVNHVAGLLYRAARRSGRMCDACGLQAQELTLRPRIPDGAYVLSNLSALCYDCV
jgi:hypothetical protein